MQVFDAYGKYYDLLYQDKDYHEEVNFVYGKLESHLNNIKSLLEFGSGTGIHGNLLAKKGMSVTGVELSAQMISMSEQSESFRCVEGDVRNVKLDKKFSAVISLFHVMSYQTSNHDVINTMKNANEHLEDGGIFLFDFWYTPAVNHFKPSTRVKRMQNSSFRVTRIAEPEVFPNENRVNVNYEIIVEDKSTEYLSTFTETHHMRHYSLPEIKLLASITGFSFLESSEFLTNNVPGEETWGVCAVLRKTNAVN